MVHVTNESVRERAAAGVAFLDEIVPGWRSRVDLQSLDIGSYDHCLLAQVYGKYYTGVSELNLLPDQAVQYGFFLAARGANVYIESRMLTEAFKELLSV
jgi:hypothetical protein